MSVGDVLAHEHVHAVPGGGERGNELGRTARDAAQVRWPRGKKREAHSGTLQGQRAEGKGQREGKREKGRGKGKGKRKGEEKQMTCESSLLTSALCPLPPALECPRSIR